MPTLRRRNSDTRNGSERPCARRWPTPPGRSRTASSGARPTSSQAAGRRPVERSGGSSSGAGRPAPPPSPAMIVLAGAGVAAGVIVCRPRRGGQQSGPDIVRVAASPRSPTTALGEGGRGDRRPGPAGRPPPASATEQARRRHHGRSRHRTAGVPARRRSDGRRGARRRRGRRDRRRLRRSAAGPAAIAVAREFAGAFVLYETGRDTTAVKAVFDETATPELAKALLAAAAASARRREGAEGEGPEHRRRARARRHLHRSASRCCGSASPASCGSTCRRRRASRRLAR